MHLYRLDLLFCICKNFFASFFAGTSGQLGYNVWNWHFDHFTLLFSTFIQPFQIGDGNVNKDHRNVSIYNIDNLLFLSAGLKRQV